MSKKKNSDIIGPEEALVRLEDMIEERGWGIILVPDEDKDYESFAYTIGLELQDFPEIISFGLSQEEACLIFQCIIVFWQKNGEILGDIEILGPELPLRLVEIDDNNEFMMMKKLHLASNRHGQRFRAVQLIFPQDDGSFQETPEQPFLPSIDF